MDYIPRQTPFHKSLVEMKTMGGIPAKICIALWMFTAISCMVSGVIWFILVGFASHSFLAWLIRKDPYAIKNYLRFTKQAYVYDPWPRKTTRNNRRPPGFAPGALK